VEFHFSVLPGFREDCLCRLGRHGWKSHTVFAGTVCAAWGGMVGRLKKVILSIDLSTRIADKFALSAHEV